MIIPEHPTSRTYGVLGSRPFQQLPHVDWSGLSPINQNSKPAHKTIKHPGLGSPSPRYKLGIPSLEKT